MECLFPSLSGNFKICISNVVTKSEERWPKHGQHQGIGILCSRRIFGSPGCRPRCWCKGNGRIAPSASSDIWSLNWRSPFDGAVPASAAGSCHWVDGTSSRSPIGRYFSRKCQQTAAGRSHRNVGKCFSRKRRMRNKSARVARCTLPLFAIKLPFDSISDCNLKKTKPIDR